MNHKTCEAGKVRPGLFSIALTRDCFDPVTNFILVLFAAVYLNNSIYASTQIVAWGANGFGEANVPPGTTNVIAISAGGENCLALNSDESLVQWGELTISHAYDPPASLKDSRSIAAGADPFSMALKSDGTVVGWGGNDYGCSTPPPGLNGVMGISAGFEHSLAVRSNGTVVAWGDNSSGQTNVPSWLSNVVAVSGGEFHSLALRSNGTVVGWGDNINGESTGVATYPQYITNGVVTLGGQVLSNVVAIAAGVDSFSLALKSDGTVIGWGFSVTGATTPPSGLGGVVAIAAGGDFGLALRRDGTVVAWGYNPYGETHVPLGLSNVVAIAAGTDTSLALTGSAEPPLRVPLSNPVRTSNSFSIRLPSQSGHVYALEFTRSFSVSTWTSLPLVAGTGGTLTLTDPTAIDSQRFYRVRRW